MAANPFHGFAAIFSTILTLNGLRGLGASRLLAQIAGKAGTSNAHRMHPGPAGKCHDYEQQTRIEIGRHASQDHPEPFSDIQEDEAQHNGDDQQWAYMLLFNSSSGEELSFEGCLMCLHTILLSSTV